MAGIRVLLEVVDDALAGEGLLECRGCAPQRCVLRPVAAHDRACLGEGVVGIGRQHAVVAGGCAESGRRGHESEPAAHAETDDAHAADDVGPGQNPLPCRLDVGIRAAGAAAHRPHGRDEASARPTVAVQVGHDGQIAEGCQLGHLLAHLGLDTEGFVHDHHGRPRAAAVRHAHDRPEGAAGALRRLVDDDVGETREAAGHSQVKHHPVTARQEIDVRCHY